MVIVNILLILLLLLIGLLFMPCRFYSQGRISETIQVEWGLAWAGGLVSARWRMPAAEEEDTGLRLGPWTRAKSTGADKARRQQREKSSRKPGSRSNWQTASMVLDRQVWIEGLDFLGRVWRSLRLRGELEGDYGTGDPALTAYIAACITLLNQYGIKCRLSPRFIDAGVNLTGSIEGQLRPGIIIWDAGRFMFKKPIRKIWWTMLREGRRQR